MTGPTGPGPAGEQVMWMMSPEAAAELALLLGTVEDFLRQASLETVIELADYPPARPTDASVWADWVADRLGGASLALHALTTPTTTRTGEPL